MLSFKGYLTESTAGGADFEPAIVMGYYSVQGLKVPSADELGISSKDYNMVLKDKSLKIAGENIVKNIISKVGKKKVAKQLGRGTYPLTPFWKSFGASNTTPKTDLMIGNSQISLKIGPAQLMSGGKAESVATFNAALRSKSVKNTLTKDPLVKSILGDFDSFVERGLTKGGTVDDFIKGSKAGKDKIISEGNKAHKQMIEKLNQLFDKSDEFKIAFAREAMTGIEKFGPKNPATAYYFLVGDKSGRSTSYHAMTENAYVRKVADAMKTSVRFKSSSQKLKGEKTGKYNYWSVVALIVNKLDDTAKQVKEEMILNGQWNFSLTEEQINENIFKIAYQRIKDFVVKLITSIKNWIVQKVENVIEFLTAEPIMNFNNTIVFPK